MRTQLLITALLVLTLASCQTVKQIPSVKSGVTRTNVPYGDVMAQPYVQASSTQSYGNDSLQKIYRWDASTAPQAVMVFVHGGCWLNAYDYTHARGLLSALANQGVTTFAIEYRRTGDEGGGWPGTLEDIHKGLAATQLWIQQSGLSDLPTSLVGHSAGGHLALLAAQQGASTQSTPFFHRVIGLAAITDPVRYAAGTNSCQMATPGFFNGVPEDVPAAYAAGTPSVTKITVPVTLLQGTADAIVSVMQSQLSGANSIMLEDAGHFDYLHAESHAYERLIELLMQEK